MSAPRIMIVDDEPQTRRVLRCSLIQRGFEVSDARSGEDALEKLRAEPPNMIILDLKLPGMSSVETCSLVRLRSAVPVIFMSASPSETPEKQLKAFEAGADDYIVKPYGMEELIARIRAVIRRAGPLGPRVIALADVEIDLESHEVKRGDDIQHLTSKEFQLFYCLVSHAGAIVSHRRLLQAVWGPDYGGEVEYLRVCVNQLRKKIEPNPAKPQYILTEPSEGYRFSKPPDKDFRRAEPVTRQPREARDMDRMNEIACPRPDWSKLDTRLGTVSRGKPAVA